MNPRPQSAWQRYRAWSRQRIKRPLVEHQWAVIVGLWVISFALGVWGFGIYASQHNTSRWLGQIVYQSLQLFTLKGGEKFGQVVWQLEIARWLSPAVAAVTAAKGLIEIFYQQAQVFRASLARNHLIVCGLSDKGRLIAKSFLEHGDKVVVIERDASRGRIAAARAEGAIVIGGDANEPATLRAAGLHRANYLIATCDDETNAEIVHQAKRMKERDSKALTCLAHIGTPNLIERLGGFTERANEPSRFSVRFFNLEESGARALASAYAPFSLDPNDRRSAPVVLIAGDDRFVKRFAEALAIRWMVRSVFSTQRLRIVSHTPRVSDMLLELRKETPALWEYIEVEVLPESTDAGMMATVDVAFVLFASPSDATVMALELLKTLRKDARLVIRHQRDAGLARLLSTAEDGARARVSVFSIYEDTCSEPDLLLGVHREMLARLVHDWYLRQYPGYIEPWSTLSETSRSSNRDQADWIERMLKDAGFQVVSVDKSISVPYLLDDVSVERLSATEHRRWCVEKIATRWTYGEKKDGALRKHPDLVPWEELGHSEQEKDRVFVRGWTRMLANDNVRFAVYRENE